jgi:hypothetical protein
VSQFSLQSLFAGIGATAALEDRVLSASSKKYFLIWTAFFWGGTGVLAALFFLGQMDFVTSTKVSLYGISIWLNGWLLALIGSKARKQQDVYHDALVLWTLSYAITNLLWEIPWVIFSPIIFKDLNTLSDVVAYTDYMRESVLNMYWWVLASFASVDLRTVNHNSTFYVVELYAFANVLSTLYFFYLNSKRSPMRYLVPVLSCGAPAAATFIFTFSEVFANYENMPGGIADTLLALVWTQYQYFVFPLLFGVWGLKLFLEDYQRVIAK